MAEPTVEELEKVVAKYYPNGISVGGGEFYIGMVNQMHDKTLPPYGTTARDVALYDAVMNSNHLAGLAYTAMLKLVNIPMSIVARDKNISAHVTRAEMYERILRTISELGGGLRKTMKRAILDYLITDKGGFMEVMGDGPVDGPIIGQPWGLLHRSSLNCRLTGDPIFPVVYVDGGKRYKLHFTRVIHIVQQPLAVDRFYGAGISSVSRSHMLAEVLTGQIVYKLEKMGRRPTTKLLIGENISAEEMISAFMAAETLMDNLGLENYGMNIFIGGTGVSVDAQDLNNFDPFNEEVGTLMAMYAIATCWGLKIQDIWPVQGAKASDQISNIQSAGRLPADFVGDVKEQLDAKALPPFMETEFYQQDPDIEQTEAIISDIRSRSIARTAEYEILDKSAHRRKMMENGEISRTEFERQQLTEGFLEDGRPVATLFYSSDPLIADLLNIGIANPLLCHSNDPEMALEAIAEAKTSCYEIMASNSESQRRKANQAFAALQWLEKEYLKYRMQPNESDEPEESEEYADEPGGDSESDEPGEPEEEVVTGRSPTGRDSLGMDRNGQGSTSGMQGE